MLRVALALAAMMGVITAADAATVVPTVYEAGHFFATPADTAGHALKLVVDTGGGGRSWLVYGDAGRAMGLVESSCEGDRTFVTPAFAPGKALPRSPRNCGMASNVDWPRSSVENGMLSGWYLSDFIVTFDYPGKRLVFEDAGWRSDASAHTVPLGFLVNRKGKLGSPFPRITLTIDGQALDVLLDTGATAHPTVAGQHAMATPVVEGYGVTSYVTTSVMNRWHEKHPDWKLVDQADDLLGAAKATRAIQVPAVAVGGWSVGPVWFTERPDKSFVDTMSSYMDGTVFGAAGANLLRSFRMTIDYARHKAYLTCIDACRPVR
ncbi:MULTISPECIES: hypothetical protein [Luteibacter]|uniref:hypothetical protein n=1 Tax=Luteibacter TaxID=242605 RepID=UPI00056CDBAF|nr:MULTISPECIES: hypothetical protein [unclassified Luteibacter]